MVQEAWTREPLTLRIFHRLQDKVWKLHAFYSRRNTIRKDWNTGLFDALVLRADRRTDSKKYVTLE